MAPKHNTYIDDSTEQEEESENREEREEERVEEDLIEEDAVVADEEEIVESNYTIEACLDENSSNFYKYTPFQDCNGDVIAATYLENPSLANFVDCGCPDCNLELSISFGRPSSFGGTDGFIIAGVIGKDEDKSSETFGDNISTGTANYTYVIEPVNAEDAGKGAGVVIGSGAVSNTKFTFGFNINLEQTGAVGNPTYATSVVKGYVPVVSATMGTSSKGLEAGTYNVYVWDSNATASCLGRKQITLTNPPRILGCTDNTTGTNDGAALNYSANAGLDNNSCIYCKASDGKLVDYQSVNYLGTGDIIEKFNINIQSATDSDNTDGVIQFSATPIEIFQTYIEDVVDAQGNVDAVYKLELYPLSEAQFNAKTIAGATKLGSTVSNTYDGSKFNYTFNSINGYNVTYGRYAIKVFIADPDTDAGFDGTEIEGCYQLRFLTVRVLAGIDLTKPDTYITIDSAIIKEKTLIERSKVVQSVVTTTPCCADPTLSVTIDPMNPNNPCYQGLLYNWDCSVVNIKIIDNLRRELQYDDPINGWTTIIEPGCTACPASWIWTGCCAYDNYMTGATLALGSNSNSSQIYSNLYLQYYGDGDYRIKQTVTDVSGGTCVKISNTVSVVQLVCGCTDATATNYNASATHDDGSCIAAPPPAPCSSATAALTVVTVDATGTCSAPNSDGTATVSVIILTGAPTWKIRYKSGSGSYGNWSAVYTANGPAVAHPNLSPGLYTAEVEDSSGCFTLISFSIGNSTPRCGCTDPTAPNYDPTAIQDDGSCASPGCTDPNATNYNPNATIDDGSCLYAPVSGSSLCVPPNISDLSDKIKLCISKNGSSFYHALISGRADECSIMNAWKLILIDYLIDPVGLPCIYNCADSSTPNAGSLMSCSDNWVTGGPATGINDMALAGSTINTGEGTTVSNSQTFFVSTNTLYAGDVIKMPSGLIWKAAGPGLQANNYNTAGFPLYNLNPETTTGQKYNIWVQCVDSMNQISFTNTTNYLDIFSNFVHKFCKDCDIPEDIDAPIAAPARINTPYTGYLD